MKTKIEKKTNDTRDLFWRLTVRKPERYADIPARPCLDAAQVEALQQLPVVDLDRPEMCDDFKRDTPREFVGMVGGFGLSYFYINTEGYDYPRYAFRLPAHPQNLKPGLSPAPDEMKAFVAAVKAVFAEEKPRLSPRARQALNEALSRIGAL